MRYSYVRRTDHIKKRRRAGLCICWNGLFSPAGLFEYLHANHIPDKDKLPAPISLRVRKIITQSSLHNDAAWLVECVSAVPALWFTSSEFQDASSPTNKQTNKLTNIRSSYTIFKIVQKLFKTNYSKQSPLTSNLPFAQSTKTKFLKINFNSTSYTNKVWKITIKQTDLKHQYVCTNLTYTEGLEWNE
jgi:hypothetical protein